jgi:hypothetical protein
MKLRNVFEMEERDAYIYNRRRHACKELNEGEDVVYIVTSEPGYESQRYAISEHALSEYMMEHYKKHGYRILKCRVEELVCPGKLSRIDPDRP